MNLKPIHYRGKRTGDWAQWSVLQTQSGFYLIDGEGHHLDPYGYDTFQEAVRDLEKMVADEIAAETKAAQSEADEARYQAHRDREIDR